MDSDTLAKPNCSLCSYFQIQLGTCSKHSLDITYPEWTLCAHFNSNHSTHLESELLKELSFDWVYSIDEIVPEPLIQVIRKRKGNSSQQTGKLLENSPFLENSDPESFFTKIDRVRFYQKYQFMLLGACQGDRLGFMTQGYDKDQIKYIYGDPISTIAVRQGDGDWSELLHSKDSYLLLAVLNSISQSSPGHVTFSASSLSVQLQKYASEMCFIGKATQEAIDKLKAGLHWSVTGILANGSGALVRLLPLCILDRAFFQEAIVLQALPTHIGKKIWSCSQLLGLASYYLLNQDPEQFDLTKFAFYLQTLVAGLDDELVQRVWEIATGDSHHLENTIDDWYAQVRPGGYVIDVLSTALKLFFVGYRDPQKIMYQGVNQGYEATTILACLGGLLGALYGDQFLLFEKDFFEADLLETISKRLV
jgi:ADP-ribosylglycohydrolase